MSGKIYRVTPLTRPPDAEIRVPGSKSITNRAILLAALADGNSRLEGVLFSDDTRYMMDALTALGVDIDRDLERSVVVVRGAGGSWPRNSAHLYVGNAGTAMRFLTAALCLGGGPYRIDGVERMRERPIGELVRALRTLGAEVSCERDEFPPVEVRRGGIRGGRVRIGGRHSSQYVSALLMVGPCLPEGIEVEISDRLVAAPYVSMTMAVMGAFGAQAEEVEPGRLYRVAGGTGYRSREYRVEPDASGAHYFLAAAALTGGRVRVAGLGRDSLQGDVRFADLLADMGAEVRWEAEAIEVRGRGRLAPIDADLNEISDTAPTAAVLAAFAEGESRLRNIAHLRWQESDRLRAVATELARLGIEAEETGDGLRIRGGSPRAARVETYQDHRIAMAFALVGLRVEGIEIADPDCVAKTFPDYFARLEELRR